MEKNTGSHSDRGYSLKSLFLDPNNYRFIDKDDYVRSRDEVITSKTVQARTLEIIKGKNNQNISDLIASFKQNGFIPVDQIQVRKVGHQKYVVIEGNRRVAALKILELEYEQGKDIGNLNPKYFKKVPVVEYEGDDEAMYKVLMGLKHISGNKKWPAINQARLLSSLLEDHNMSEEDIYRSLGISKIEMRTTRRTLSLIKRYQESDFGDQFTSDKYSTFREIIKSPKVKDWLNLNPNDIEIKNVDENNLYRLFSWISTTEEEIEDSDLESDEAFVILKEPIIETALQVRELAKIINDKNALNNLESTRSLLDATLSSETLGANKLENALTLVKEQINIAFNYSYLIDDDKTEEISESIHKLKALLVTRNKFTENDLESGFNKSPIVESCNSHFSSITINNYKKFKNFNLNNFSRVNLFAGINNVGKSTLLEVLYLLSKLGDTKSLITLDKYRRKAQGSFKVINIYNTLNSIAEFSGTFNSSTIKLKIITESDTEIKNKSDYIGRISTECEYVDNIYEHHTDFYNKKFNHYSSSNHTLCNSVISFSSSFDDEEVFKDCYRKSVTNGAKVKVIEFIRENIDKDINDIELSDIDGTFIVIYNDARKNMDLSLFGDGLQKIFYLGIKFSACSNGILLLDEIENGIHKDLLNNFTKLIQQLSEAYNVQVFATSHSKECIDSFLLNNFKNEDISAYALMGDDGRVEHFTGSELEGLIDYIDVDIRGSR